jgi:hypothetical protein
VFSSTILKKKTTPLYINLYFIVNNQIVKEKKQQYFYNLIAYLHRCYHFSKQKNECNIKIIKEILLNENLKKKTLINLRLIFNFVLQIFS